MIRLRDSYPSPEAPLLFSIGLLTSLLAGFRGILELGFKKIIALSTLSQLGLIITRVGVGQTKIAAFHLLSHAIFKALIFLRAGSVIYAKGSSLDLRLIGTSLAITPLATAGFACASLSLIGIPIISGFYSKDAIIEASGERGLWALSFSLGLTSAYSLRLIRVTLGLS